MTVPLHTPSPASPKRYRAFISYSRKDEMWARRIHAALEAYRAPRGISAHVDHKTRRLGRVFRDDDEMCAAQSLGATIENALLQAETLIVICSPHSARSAWVDTEVRRYRTTPNAHVLGVIVSGRPNAEDPAEECFCPGLRWRVAADGHLTDILDEPMAPDVRREGLDRVIARLAAGVLGVSFDDLWRRQVRRANRRWLGIGSLTAALCMTSLGVLMHHDDGDHVTNVRTPIEVATERLEVARETGEIPGLEGALRFAIIAAAESDLRLVAQDLVTEIVAATRTQWRIGDLGGPIAQIAFSDDGNVVFVVTNTGRVTLVNMETGHEINRLELGGVPIAIAPNGAYVLVKDTGADPVGAKLWRSDTWIATTLPGSAPTCASFNQTTGTMATCGPDGGARLWRVETGALIQTIANAGPAWTTAQFDTPGEQILFSAGYGSWSIWDVESVQTVATLPNRGRNLDWKTPGIYNYFVAGLSAAPYGAALTPMGVTPLSGHDDPVTRAHMFGAGPGNLRIASGDAGGRLVVSAVSHPVTRPVFNIKGHVGGITALAMSPDMKHAATGGADASVRIWSLAPLAAPLKNAIVAQTDPVAMICDETAHHLPHDARLITSADATALPSLATEIGQDVCQMGRK